MKKIIQEFFGKFGYVIHKKSRRWEPAANLNFLGEQVFSTDFELKIIEKHLKFTLTSPARMAATMRSLKYVSNNKIAGAFVECGVWKGGQILAGAEQLELLNDFREVYLYDTFSGMTSPTEVDVDLRNDSAIDQLKFLEPTANNLWAAVTAEEVEENLRTIEYPRKYFRFIVGDVMETLMKKDNLPSSIAVLRLDTDWFDSTYQELKVLYPLLSPGGVLLIDDYGHWKGSKLAAEKFFQEIGIDPFWSAVDYSCVMHVKIN